MNALKIIVISIVVIVVSAALVAGGYYLATNMQKTNDTAQNDTDNSGSDANSNNSGSSNNSTPAKVTTEPTCNADELTLTTTSSDQSGAGTLALNLIMTNSGERECRLVGYPGVSLVNNNGNMIGEPAARTQNATENTVTLTPGQAAVATLIYPEEGNFDPGECTGGATKLRVYPPNDTGYLSIAQTAISSWCPGFTVSPVRS